MKLMVFIKYQVMAQPGRQTAQGRRVEQVEPTRKSVAIPTVRGGWRTESAARAMQSHQRAKGECADPAALQGDGALALYIGRKQGDLSRHVRGSICSSSAQSAVHRNNLDKTF
jgi:hypothetical protein